MSKEIIERLLPQVKSACPKDLELSIKKLPLSKTRFLHLLIIKYDKDYDDIDEWAIHDVYKLFHTLFRIFENANVGGKVRFLFCNKNDFVLYTPINTLVLDQFDGLIFRECFGYDYYTHLIGKAYDIDKLIEYLLNRGKNF